VCVRAHVCVCMYGCARMCRRSGRARSPHPQKPLAKLCSPTPSSLVPSCCSGTLFAPHSQRAGDRGGGSTSYGTRCTSYGTRYGTRQAWAARAMARAARAMARTMARAARAMARAMARAARAMARAMARAAPGCHTQRDLTQGCHTKRCHTARAMARAAPGCHTQRYPPEVPHPQMPHPEVPLPERCHTQGRECAGGRAPPTAARRKEPAAAQPGLLMHAARARPLAQGALHAARAYSCLADQIVH